MARYTIENEAVVVETRNARGSWEEETYWNGNNHISKATGSQWEHETLYQSQKGRWYVVHTSQWQGSTDYARMLSDREAALWLLRNDHDLPDSLAHHEADLCE